MIFFQQYFAFISFLNGCCPYTMWDSQREECIGKCHLLLQKISKTYFGIVYSESVACYIETMYSLIEKRMHCVNKIFKILR